MESAYISICRFNFFIDIVLSVAVVTVFPSSLQISHKSMSFDDHSDDY